MTTSKVRINLGKNYQVPRYARSKRGSTFIYMVYARWFLICSLHSYIIYLRSIQRSVNFYWASLRVEKNRYVLFMYLSYGAAMQKIPLILIICYSVKILYPVLSVRGLPRLLDHCFAAYEPTYEQTRVSETRCIVRFFRLF